jgi:hypothetical protein
MDAGASDFKLLEDIHHLQETTDGFDGMSKLTNTLEQQT